MNFLKNNDEKTNKDYYQIFEAIYHKYKKIYFSYILKFVCNYHTAEELLQEVFLKIAENLPALKDQTKVKSWGFQITANVCRQWYRKIKKERINFMEQLDIIPQSAIVKDETSDKSSNGLVVINKILQDLSYEEKNLFILKYWEKLNYEEIAGIVKMSQRTIRRRLKSIATKVIHILRKKNILKGKYYNFNENEL